MRKKVFFNVSYYTCGSNKNPYFTTSADEMNYIRSDYGRCGQCQKDLLKRNTVALNFFNKWDEKHLKDLSSIEYKELMQDIEELKAKYPHFMEDTPTQYKNSISFNRKVAFDRLISNLK